MAAHQAPPSLGFSRQEYWRGLPDLGRRVQKGCFVFASKMYSDVVLQKSIFPLSLNLMLGHHSSAEQLPDGPVIVSEDLLQDVRRVLPEKGRRPGL